MKNESMKSKKQKVYVLIISNFFPKAHKKNGEPTGFPLAIKHYDKIHTIRGNYALWAKRFEKIDKGEAVLSVRIWDGVPYDSNQLEIFRYDRTHKIGIEKLTFTEMIMTTSEVITTKSKVGIHIWKPNISKVETLAKNDGLSLEDFKDWFKGYDLSKDMAVIHFTAFRYKNVIFEKKNKNKYYLHWKIRKQGFNLNTTAKTIYIKDNQLELTKQAKKLVNVYGYSAQTQMFN